MGHFYFIRHGQTVWNVEKQNLAGLQTVRLQNMDASRQRKTGQKILAEGIKADEISALRLAGQRILPG